MIDQSYRDGYDIAGNPRVFGKNIDIGAVEYAPNPVIKSDVASLQRGCSTTITAELADSQFEDCSFVWDLDGDGAFGQSVHEIGQNVLFDSFPYAQEVNGKRIVKVLLQDERGHRSNPVEYGITMEKVMPCYELLMPEDITAKRTAWFEFNASDPAGLAVMDWLVSWGDGSEDTHIPGGPRNRVELNHRYTTKGEYSIEITTTNILGEKSTVSMPVSVLNAATENKARDIVLEEFIQIETKVDVILSRIFESDISVVFEQTTPEATVAAEAYWRRENQGIPKSDGSLSDFIFAYWSEEGDLSIGQVVKMEHVVIHPNLTRFKFCHFATKCFQLKGKTLLSSNRKDCKSSMKNRSNRKLVFRWNFSKNQKSRFHLPKIPKAIALKSGRGPGIK